MQSELQNFVTDFSNNIGKFLEKKLARISPEEISFIKSEIAKYIAQLLSIADVAERKNIATNATFAESKKNILHVIAKFGDEAQLNSILQINAEADYLNSGDSELFTPLHYAAQNGQLGIVKILLASGADKNAQTSMHTRRWTPAHFATKHGHLEIVKTFIEAGVDKEMRTGFGLNILHISAEFGHLELAKYCLAIGVSKDTKSIPENLEMTPLHYAVIGNFAPVVEVLLSAGVKRDELMTNGDSALQIAVQNGSAQIASMLLKCGVDRLDEALIIAKKSSNQAIVKEIELYQKAIKNLFKNPEDFAANFISVIKDFKSDNLYQPKIILAGNATLNAYGILNVKCEIGLFSKEKMGLTQLAEKKGLLELVAALKALAQLIK